jgi:hypothetical protein
MVLCFGTDGHIALEPAHNHTRNTTAPTRAETHPQAARVLACIETAGACVDVTFLACESDGQLLPASNTSPRPETSMIVPVFLLMPVSTMRLAPSILPNLYLSRHHSLTILRSVVLHI